MSPDLKHHALIELTSKLREELQKPTNLNERKQLINTYVDDLEKMFRHYKHRIKVINNGMYDAHIFICYIAGSELVSEVIVIEANNVSILM